MEKVSAGEGKPTQKLNCWQYKNCGREPGGRMAHELGVCPASEETLLDGFHGGINAGRACWAVAGTLCGGEVKGTFAKKMKDCLQCEFHHMVINEEDKYKSAALHLKKLRKEEKNVETAQTFRQPGFLKHVYAKSKRASEDGVDSLYITFLIVWTTLCPSISMLEGAKRLCKDDLVDELMVIDAIADHPNFRATKLFTRTIFRALRKQVKGYFAPLMEPRLLGSLGTVYTSAFEKGKGYGLKKRSA